MPTTDQHEKRVYANQVKRHKQKLQALAEHIHEYAGYLLRETQEGTPLASTHVATIALDIAEMQRRISALDALNEISFVFDDA